MLGLVCPKWLYSTATYILPLSKFISFNLHCMIKDNKNSSEIFFLYSPFFSPLSLFFYLFQFFLPPLALSPSLYPLQTLFTSLFLFLFLLFMQFYFLFLVAYDSKFICTKSVLLVEHSPSLIFLFK